MKVLLAVDGSKYTKKMLAYLTTHENLLGVAPEFIVLNVQPAVPASAAKIVGNATVVEYHHAESEAVINPVAKFLDRHQMSYTSGSRVGHAADEILRAAKKSNVDLIVMGSRGRGTIGTLLLGSVAQSVLSASEVPVMVIR